MDWIWDLLKYKKTICDLVVYANTEKCLWLGRVFEYRKMFCGKQFFFERGQTVTKLPAVQTLVPAAAQADGLCLLRNFSGDVLFQHFCCRMVMVTEHHATQTCDNPWHHRSAKPSSGYHQAPVNEIVLVNSLSFAHPEAGKSSGILPLKPIKCFTIQNCLIVNSTSGMLTGCSL